MAPKIVFGHSIGETNDEETSCQNVGEQYGTKCGHSARTSSAHPPPLPTLACLRKSIDQKESPFSPPVPPLLLGIAHPLILAYTILRSSLALFTNSQPSIQLERVVEAQT